MHEDFFKYVSIVYLGGIALLFGGGGEIRTLGTFRFTRFPSVRTRPLCDASVRGFYTTNYLTPPLDRGVLQLLLQLADALQTICLRTSRLPRRTDFR